MAHDTNTFCQVNTRLTPRKRWLRLSARHLLAVGALCAANPASAVEITSPLQLQSGLNGATINSTNFNVQLEILADINLGGSNLTFGSGLPRGLGRLSSPDVGGRTISNGSITISSPSDTNYSLLTFDPTVSWDADIILNDFARIDIDGPAALGPSATVTAAGSSEIRLFTFDGGTNTFDATFFGKITGVADQTTFAITGNGETILSALPTFDAIIEINPYSDFDFSTAPDVDPTLQLGANLSGNHEVIINAGTLDLNDFDFTIDSLAGVADTAVTLGSGTLTTGDDSDTTYAGVISGSGNLTKTGTGTFSLTGVNTYTGNTTVSDGTLVFGADQTGTTAVIIENGGTLLVSEDQTGTPTYTIQSGGTADLNADLADTTEITVDAGGMLNLNGVDQTLALLDGGGNIALNDASVTFGDATDTTLSGIISGSGGITKTGTSNITLSGMNTYTGATTINEGTLTLDGDLADTTAVSIASGALLDLNDNDQTLGSIAGEGDIDLGTATLSAGGNNTTTTFDGEISGTGGLTKQGTGTLTLSMDQTYTGSTLISGGTLTASGDLATSDVTLDAGAFNLAGELTDAAATVTVNGGTMTISGDQTYTGATAINGGTLTATGDLATSGVTIGDGATFALESIMTDGTADVTVDDGGTIYGTGTVGNDLNNNGTVTFFGPGEGDTLTVNGDYTQGATGVLEIQLGDPGGLVVTGTANLDGTLNVNGPADPANFDITATYNALSAGTLAGNFADVNSDFIFLDLTSTPVGGNVEITLARNATTLASIARTPNQAAVANALDGLVAPTGNLALAINRILASSEQQALTTYDQLAGAGAATAGTQNAAAAVNQGNRVLDQVSGIAPGSSRPQGDFGQAPKTDFGFDDGEHLTLFSAYQSPDSADNRQDNAGWFDDAPGKAWATFYGGFGDQGEGAQALDYNRYGVLSGLEFESVESGARYGVSLGVEVSDFEFAQSNGEVDITSVYLSGYTRQPLGNDFHFTLNGSLGYHGHESARDILIGTTPTPANADFNSYSISVAAELSKTFDLVFTPADPGNHPTVTTIEPFARLNYSLSSQESYSESGAGSAGLNVASADFDSTRAALGVRTQYQFMLINRHEATLFARGLVDVALQNSDSRLGVSFVGTPGSNFSIEGSDQDDLFGQIGGGFSVELGRRWDFQAGVDFQLSDDATATVVSGGLSYSF